MSRLDFEQRIFAAIFLISFFISGVCLWVTFGFVIKKTQKDYFSKYKTLSHVLGNTLLQLERNTELLMANAAKVIQIRDKEKGPLSTEDLKQLAAQLNLTHVFVIDKTGRFIRSTNESPTLIPNLFSFCDHYRQLITGDAASFTTPIIPPQPELNPYKFLMVPTFDHKRIIEVGIKAEFIGNTLAQALREDLNIKELYLFAPDGTSLGAISRENKIYHRDKVDLSHVSFAEPALENGALTFYAKVTSTQPICCQCERSHLSRGGEYYYILKSLISVNALKAEVRSIAIFFLFIQILLIALALLGARFVSRRLVQAIHSLNSSVRKIASMKDRVPVVGGPPEIRDLANSFNDLLHTLEGYQEQLIEAQKGVTEVAIARQVAHDIRAPLTSLQILAATLKDAPPESIMLLQKACERIKKVANDLMARQSHMSSMGGHDGESPVLIASVISDVVREKELLYPRARITFTRNLKTYRYFVRVNLEKFARVLSNLINNSVEAGASSVSVEAFQAENRLCIVLQDNGPGFPPDILEKIGLSSCSTKGAGRGLGMTSAREFIAAWGGGLKIENFGAGARVTISLPLAGDTTELDAFLNRAELKL